MKTTSFITSIALCYGMSVYAAEPITQENWLSHPDIIEIRKLYRQIHKDKNEGRLKKTERNYDYCEPYQDTVRRLYIDKNSAPRIYYNEGGSDDSAVHTEIYYDAKGIRRFAFIRAGAVNGTKLEHRVYFSPGGKKIWEARKLLEGPGYTFPHEWPDSELYADPQGAFSDKNPCPLAK